MINRSQQRTFFVDASRSSIGEVERVIDADLDEERIWIDAVEEDGTASAMVAVDFWTYGLDVDQVESALRYKLQQAGFNTVGYTERFGTASSTSAA